jgi:flagellin-like protein
LINLRINRNRKAISPVLATVILIAITLIAAIAIAGFVFGLFGSFTSSAQVSGRVQSCVSAVGPPITAVCTVVLTNTGTSNTAAIACSLKISGTSAAGVLTVSPTPVGASGSATAICTVNPASAVQTSGSQAVGSFSMSNGATVPFSGIWQ